MLAGVLLAGVLAATLPGPAAAAVSVPTPLLQDPPDIRTPLSSGSAVTFIVDRQRKHLFAATGYPVSTVMVTNLAGEMIETLPGQVGAKGMAISADGNWLYVALREDDAISVIDLNTLTEHHRVTTGRETCPTWLATAGSQLWVSYGCSYNSANIVALDPSQRSVQLPPAPDARYYTPPQIASASPTSNLVVAAVGSFFNSTIDLYDTSSGALVRRSTYYSDRVYYASAVAMTPDERTVFVVAIDGSGRFGSYGAIAFSTPNLVRGPLYRTAPHTSGIAVSPDGSHLAMTTHGALSSDFWVFPVGVPTPTHSRNYPDLQGPGSAVAYSPDGAKAFIYRRQTDNSPSLTIVRGLDVDPARISVRPAPSAGIPPGAAASLSGTMRMTDGTSTNRLAVNVTRSGPDGRRTLPPVMTGPDGGFAVADVPPGPGGYTYRFTWPGDAAHPPASASTSLRVLGAGPTVLPAPPAAPSSEHDLNLQEFGALVVDELHRRAFVSDKGGGVVAVTDLDGNRTGTITGLAGAAGMALSRDSTTLFVALSGAGAIAAVDTADLVEVGRWPTGPLAEIPVTVAEAGNQVFFGYRNFEDSGGGWGSFNLSSPYDVWHWSHIKGPIFSAVFATSPAEPDVLIAGGIYGQTGRYDVSTTPPRELAYKDQVAGGLDPRLSDDGSTLILNDGGLVDPTTLATSLNPDYVPEHDISHAVAMTSDASFVAVGADRDSATSRVRIFPRGGDEPLRTVGLRGQAVWAGMDFTTDASRLYVVTAETSTGGRHPVLHVLNRPTAPKAVTASGFNGLGALGQGPASATRLTTSPPTGTISVAAGSHHSVALGGDGSVWTWGWNGYGQLGNGSTTSSAVPVKVPGLSDVVAVSAGMADTFAVKRDGTVWAWGWNLFGQLGDGTTVDRSTPVRVAGLSGITSVAAGAYHSLALGRDGKVWSWGWNGLGLLGDGTTTDRLLSQLVPGPPMRSIAAGWLHSLAVDAESTVWAWGWNAYGQLGDATTADRLSPVRLMVAAHAAEVAAGAYHSMMRTSGGQVWTWGWNGAGQVGDGTLADRRTPAAIAGIYSGVTSISAGMGHSVAVVDGVAMGWGWNPYGQLGDGTSTDRRVPSAMAGLTSATNVAAGGLHSLAI